MSIETDVKDSSNLPNRSIIYFILSVVINQYDNGYISKKPNTFMTRKNKRWSMLKKLLNKDYINHKSSPIAIFLFTRATPALVFEPCVTGFFTYIIIRQNVTIPAGIACKVSEIKKYGKFNRELGYYLFITWNLVTSYCKDHRDIPSA